MEQPIRSVGSITESLKQVFVNVVEYLPNIVGALALIVLGLLVAFFLKVVSMRLLKFGAERISRTHWFEARLHDHVFFLSLPKVLSRIIYWIVLLFFIAAAIEALGLRIISDIISSATTYLPRVFAAILIVFFGFLLSEFIRNWLIRVAAKAGFAMTDLLGRIVQIAILITAILIGVDQLGIDSSIPVLILAITTGSVFAGAALAFGLGAGPTVTNIIACHYLRRHYKEGDRIKIGPIEGTIEEINRTAVILDSAKGKVQIPARRFNEEISIRLEETA